jgi:hypothetical protein
MRRADRGLPDDTVMIRHDLPGTVFRDVDHSAAYDLPVRQGDERLRLRLRCRSWSPTRCPHDLLSVCRGGRRCASVTKARAIPTTQRRGGRSWANALGTRSTGARSRHITYAIDGSSVPFCRTRTWLMITGFMLVLTILVGIVVGSRRACRCSSGSCLRRSSCPVRRIVGDNGTRLSRARSSDPARRRGRA